MKKRDFLKKTAVGATGIMVSPLIGCEGGSEKQKEEMAKDTAKAMQESTEVMNFELPKLPYATDALSPAIDQRTMEIHHGKHHAGYVKKLNKALAETPMGGGLESIFGKLEDKESHSAIRNNGGGHYNHSLFWKVMTPSQNLKKPDGEMAKAFEGSFGSFESALMEFKEAAGSVFGSGWAWLCVDSQGDLFIETTANQDNPLMTNIMEAQGKRSGKPILGIDVWEHAYYLKYKNGRGSYIEAFSGLINWTQVYENYKAAIS